MEEIKIEENVDINTNKLPQRKAKKKKAPIITGTIFFTIATICAILCFVLFIISTNLQPTSDPASGIGVAFALIVIYVFMFGALFAGAGLYIGAITSLSVGVKTGEGKIKTTCLILLILSILFMVSLLALLIVFLIRN